MENSEYLSFFGGNLTPFFFFGAFVIAVLLDRRMSASPSSQQSLKERGGTTLSQERFSPLTRGISPDFIYHRKRCFPPREKKIGDSPENMLPEKTAETSPGGIPPLFFQASLLADLENPSHRSFKEAAF